MDHRPSTALFTGRLQRLVKLNFTGSKKTAGFSGKLTAPNTINQPIEMKFKSAILFIVTIALFAACSEDAKKTETTAIQKPAEAEVPVKPDIDTTENLQNFVVNNELTENWLKALNQVDPSEFNGYKKPVTNRHNPAVTDTIVTLQNGPTTIEYYHTATNQMLQAARINNGAIKLGNTVRIGMPKTQLEKIVLQKIAGNNIQIGDEEKFSIFRFEFAADTLKSIVFEGYVD